MDSVLGQVIITEVAVGVIYDFVVVPAEIIAYTHQIDFYLEFFAVVGVLESYGLAWYCQYCIQYLEGCQEDVRLDAGIQLFHDKELVADLHLLVVAVSDTVVWYHDIGIFLQQNWVIPEKQQNEVAFDVLLQEFRQVISV